MSTIDINEIILQRHVESWRPEDLQIRKQLDYDYAYDGKVAILYELRPVWNNPEKTDKMEFAIIRFIQSKHEWRLYWMRSNGKWEPYEPLPKSSTLERILTAINEDQYGCFFG